MSFLNFTNPFRPSIVIVAFLLMIQKSYAQYWTSGGELIFASADYKVKGDNISGPLRFSLFFHLNSKYNLDVNNVLGFALGYSIKNLGFATRGESFAPLNDPMNPKVYDKIVRRSYTLGVPAMIKIGNMQRDRFIVVGGEYELLFHFKEKRFKDGEKTKRTDWMSSETNRFLPSLFVGMQFSRLGMIKLQYYLDDFLNTGYSTNGFRPYQDSESRIIYLSWMGNIRAKKMVEGGKKLKEREYSARNQRRSESVARY